MAEAERREQARVANLEAELEALKLALVQTRGEMRRGQPQPGEAAEGQRGDEDEQLQYLLMQVENRNFTRRIHDFTITI